MHDHIRTKTLPYRIPTSAYWSSERRKIGQSRANAGKSYTAKYSKLISSRTWMYQNCLERVPRKFRSPSDAPTIRGVLFSTCGENSLQQHQVSHIEVAKAPTLSNCVIAGRVLHSKG